MLNSPNRAYGVGMRKIAYLAVAIATALFGYLALFSIGFPFLLTGLLMLALTPLRRRIEIMFPALLWPWLFTLGYVLVAPLGCTRFTMPTIVDGVGSLEGTTRCNACSSRTQATVRTPPQSGPRCSSGSHSRLGSLCWRGAR